MRLCVWGGRVCVWCVCVWVCVLCVGVGVYLHVCVCMYVYVRKYIHMLFTFFSLSFPAVYSFQRRSWRSSTTTPLNCLSVNMPKTSSRDF